MASEDTTPRPVLCTCTYGRTPETATRDYTPNPTCPYHFPVTAPR